MNPILRNILAILAGLIIGSIVNMGIIMISGSIIPPPDGADVTTMEGLQASMNYKYLPTSFTIVVYAFGSFNSLYSYGLDWASFNFEKVSFKLY